MLNSELIIKDAILQVAKNMVVAAKTAPKGRGIDNLATMIVDAPTIKLISEKMILIGTKTKQDFFIRDARNILHAPYMVFFGSYIKPLELDKCGLCGFKNCNEKKKKPNVPCVFNTGDLGIAIGSAVSIAANARVDNRVMFSAGQAVKSMGLMGKGVKIIYGIPLSATSKNPFFDRIP
ncbi:MAG: DUF2148 domain-containing protein [Bacteroidales bacterium]|nr:DUF2148 domain-containing protein [Bacteroidales bacterium]